MDPPSSIIAHAFGRDLRLAEVTAHAHLAPGRTIAASATWINIWSPFCRELGFPNPFLPTLPDKVPLLLVFAQRYRNGRIAKRGLPVRAETVSAALLQVAAAFTSVGSPDPRFNTFGKLDQRIVNLYTAWSKQDPAPTRVKPIPIQLLHHAQVTATASNDHSHLATIDMAWLAFFFLLRPGEYCHSAQSHPFRLGNLRFSSNHQQLDPCSCDLRLLHSATLCSLTFATQKNRIRGEIIAHGRSGDPIACPLQTLLRRVTHLCAHGATASTPLHAYRIGAHWGAVSPAMVSLRLRAAAADMGNTIGISPADISARALRAGGAMALLCANVDHNTIRLVGRWCLDAMLRYLHIQASALVAPLAPSMLRGGHYAIPPKASMPADAAATRARVPTGTVPL